MKEANYQNLINQKILLVTRLILAIHNEINKAKQNNYVKIKSLKPFTGSRL